MSADQSSIKLIVLIKRQPGPSFDEFQAYYENIHSKMISHLPAARRYFRRYLHPLMPNPAGEPYDVIAEIWFDSRSDMEASMRILANPAIHEANAAEEARFIDHMATRLYVVDERHSDLPGA